jgi:hypothetical protein
VLKDGRFINRENDRDQDEGILILSANYSFERAPVSRSYIDGITKLNLQSLLDEGCLIVIIEGRFISPLQLPPQIKLERELAPVKRMFGGQRCITRVNVQSLLGA